MAFRYKLPSGEIIEADTAEEIQELYQLLKQGGRSVARSETEIAADAPGTSTEEIFSRSRNFSSEVPSVKDFLLLWDSLETEKARNVLRFFAKYGNKGLTSRKLAQYLDVERASGIMSGINKRSEKIGFSWKRWFTLHSGVYEVDSRAYKNLVEAVASKEPQQFQDV